MEPSVRMQEMRTYSVFDECIKCHKPPIFIIDIKLWVGQVHNISSWISGHRPVGGKLRNIFRSINCTLPHNLDGTLLDSWGNVVIEPVWRSFWVVAVSSEIWWCLHRLFLIVKSMWLIRVVIWIHFYVKITDHCITTHPFVLRSASKLHFIITIQQLKNLMSVFCHSSEQGLHSCVDDDVGQGLLFDDQIRRISAFFLFYCFWHVANMFGAFIFL